MISNKSVFFVLFVSVQKSFSLIELPRVEENDILKAEATIRSTINGIFALFGEKETYATPRIKHFGYVLNYFVSLTLEDYNCLKEIKKLTRYNKSIIDNSAPDFIDSITQIIEENKIVEQQGLADKNDVIQYELQKNNHIKNIIEHEKNKNQDINKQVLKILELEDKPLALDNLNEEKQTNDEDGVLEDLDTWKEHDELLSGRRLFNSKPTRVHSFAFVVSVQIFNKFQCTGSIIKEDLVVTAASCLQLAWNNRFFRENPAFISVRVGSNYYGIGGEVIGALEIFFYPSYNPQTIKHNIALMRLQRKIKFKKKKKMLVKKILIDKEESALPMNVGKITVVGWGARTEKTTILSPDKIRYALLDVYPLKDCQSVYSKDFVTKNNFCGGFISVGGGACHKDLGGPGIVSGILTGIVSFGAPVCGTPDAPTVFTKVGYYFNWIKAIIDKSPYESKARKTTKRPPTSNTFYNAWMKNALIQRTPKSTPKSTLSTIYSSPVAKPNIQHLGNNMLTDFLRTLFEGQVIEHYLDTYIKNRESPAVFKQNASLHKNPETDRTYQAELSIKFTTTPDLFSTSNVYSQATSDENMWWYTDNGPAKITKIFETKESTTNALPMPSQIEKKGRDSQPDVIFRLQKILLSRNDTRVLPTYPLQPGGKFKDVETSINYLLPVDTIQSVEPLTYFVQPGPITSKSKKPMAYTHTPVGRTRFKTVKPLTYTLSPVGYIPYKHEKPITYSRQLVNSNRMRTTTLEPFYLSKYNEPKDKTIDQIIAEAVLSVINMSYNENTKLDSARINKKDNWREYASNSVKRNTTQYTEKNEIVNHIAVINGQDSNLNGINDDSNGETVSGLNLNQEIDLQAFNDDQNSVLTNITQLIFPQMSQLIIDNTARLNDYRNSKGIFRISDSYESQLSNLKTNNNDQNSKQSDYLNYLLYKILKAAIKNEIKTLDSNETLSDSPSSVEEDKSYQEKGDQAGFLEWKELPVFLSTPSQKIAQAMSKPDKDLLPWVRDYEFLSTPSQLTEKEFKYDFLQELKK